ncbi:uncharacterized protein LOC133196363 [Saccostrea echinata]|uniref:uncharacterized protein LOC133196363 n=1 Tax=Saccostrea echinata TaxID=191078 RepID=UPI002A83AEF3|nr:uncharacterized protein LOC133196363 [Saccostrea echinata]
MSQTVTFGWIWILGLLFAVVAYVQCSCTVTPAKIEKTYTGRVRHYCVHNVTKGNSTAQIELLLDSKFETRDCQRCTCSRMGLSCCGYGVASNEPIHVPKGCHPVEDGCRIALISDIDNVTDCYSIGPPAAERRQQEMMRDMARSMAHQQYPQAMQYWRGLNPPRIHPMAALFGGGRRGPNGRMVEQPEGLMESFLLMSMFGGGMGLDGGSGLGPQSTGASGDPIGHMGGGGQSMGGLGMGGSFMDSPLGMSLLFSSFMS